MKLEKLLEDGKRWRSQISVEEVMEASESPGLCLIRMANLDEDNLGAHVKAISQLDFKEGKLSYIDAFGKTQNRSLDSHFFEEHVIFNPFKEDYENGVKVEDTNVTKIQINQRANKLYKNYFSFLLKGYEKGIIGSAAATQFKPRLLRYVALGAFALMLVTGVMVYRFEFNPGQYEKGLFKPIHAEYRQIKEKNIERLAGELRTAHLESVQDESAFETFKKDPGFGNDDAFFIMSPNHEFYIIRDLEHVTKPNFHGFGDFTQIKPGTFTSDYFVGSLMAKVVMYAIEHPEAMVKAKVRATGSDNNYHLYDMFYMEVPASVINTSYISGLSASKEKENFRLLFQKDFGFHNTIQKGADLEKQIGVSQAALAALVRDIRMYQRFEPNHKIGIPPDIRHLVR